MNREILKVLGFEKELNAIDNNLCPLCNSKINPDDFKDNLSRREYEISGMCQACQDKTFG